MRSISNRIDRFAYTHPNFGIPNLMKYITICNALVFLLSRMDRTGMFMFYMYFNPSLVMNGQVWRLLTFLFVPFTDSLFWEVIALFCYYSIGTSLERFWGTAKFTLFYIGAALSTIIYGVLVSLFYRGTYAESFVLLDATYINLSLFLAFAAINPDAYFTLYFIIPIKAKYIALLYLLPTVSTLILSPFPLNLTPIVALINFFFFCGGYIWENTATFRKSNSKAARNFRSSIKRAEREAAKQEYRHKCAVCGRTDVSNPELEFRYCSRCSGYHCFCEDHINNHVHFQ